MFYLIVSYLKTNINLILNNFKISYMDIFNVKPIILDSVKNHMNWKTNMIAELIDCKNGICVTNLNSKEISDIIYDLCVC